MAKIIHYCPVCSKPVDLISESRIMNLIQRRFACGHVQCKSLISSRDFSNFISDDFKRPYPFQVEGAAFTLNSGSRCLIMDEMGLGKTIQAIMVVSKLRQADPKLRYCIICKKKLKIQMLREFARWSKDEFISQIIENENDFISPAAGFIISYDTLWRFKDIPDFAARAKLGSGILILDEVQHIKNSAAKRTNGVRALSREMQYCIALSGTPIKNHAGEFFPILNILRPDRYHNASQFEALECVQYRSGYGYKIGGLKDAKAFHEKNKDFIIRRLKSDVLPDLPAISREFMFTELGDDVEKLYVEELKKFQQYYLYDLNGSTNFQKQSELLGYLNRMRSLTGRAKVDIVADYLLDFIESYEDTKEKIVVFLHHKDVASRLLKKLDELGLASQTVYLSAEAGSQVVDQFKDNPAYRIMLASTLAAGEGLNLQFCSFYIMMERQWNPANEEQPEGRFSRPGQTANKIKGVYPTAVGTIDEFLAEIVEKKRAVSANVLDAKEVNWNESSIIQELAEVLATTGGKRWGF